jgi:glycosyltransferase involved in cell wall biosynthesis
MMEGPTVSVVIPTVDRPGVRVAVVSALNQTYAPLEVLVAVDRKDDCFPPELHDLRDKICVVFSGGVGPSGARMQALLKAKGDVIAFLDDDDEWFPQKLEQQLSMWPTVDSKPHALLSCRYVLSEPDQKPQRIEPLRAFESGERVAAYLFRRSRIENGEGALHTSTLMCDRGLLIVEPWDSSLLLHEDWDWILRVGARSDVEIAMSPAVLARISTGDPRSLSKSGKLEQSLSWAERQAGLLTPRELGDFLLCHAAVVAIRSGNRRGALTVAHRALTQARPGFPAWLVWILHLFPLVFVEKGLKILNWLRRKDLRKLPFPRGIAVHQ